MKNYILKLSSMIAASALVIATSAAFAEQRDILKEVTDRGVIHIATASDVPPYSTLGANGELQGFDIDMGKMIAAELGVKPEFSIVDGPGPVSYTHLTLPTKRIV